MRLPKIYREVEQKDVRSDFTATNDAAGTFSGYLSTFGTVDLQGDRVLKGAFRQTIRDAQARRSQNDLDFLFPVTFGHNLDVLPAGGILTATEDSHGLLVTGQLNMGTQAGIELYNSMKAKMINTMSIGYRTITADWTKENGQSVRNLKEIALVEAAVVNIPANPDARILSVKSQGAYAMPTKDFATNYHDEQVDDWCCADWYDLSGALQQSVQECFSTGGDPMAALESDVIPGFLSALRAYVAEGMSLGYVPDPDEQMYPSMMSAGTASDEKAGRVLSAASRTALQRIASGITSHVQDIQQMQTIDRNNALSGYQMYSASARDDREGKAGFSDSQHGILDKATRGILGHVRSLKSMAAVAARTNALRGWPIVRATSSDRSIFESKESEEESREMIGLLAESMKAQAGLRELKELREANTEENPLVSGVNAALARFLSATEGKRRT